VEATDMIKTRRYQLKDSYLDLLRRFPLRPIRTEQAYDEAAGVLQDLFMRPDLDGDQQDYVEILAMLIEAYDRAHYDPGPDDRSPLDRLRGLMDDTGMSVNDLGKVLGSQPAASMVLAGKRQLSKAHIRRLAGHFRLEPGYFL
jgi:HTH-type transcriptional regulator / antitoxin HigA